MRSKFVLIAKKNYLVVKLHQSMLVTGLDGGLTFFLSVSTMVALFS